MKRKPISIVLIVFRLCLTPLRPTPCRCRLHWICFADAVALARVYLVATVCWRCSVPHLRPFIVDSAVHSTRFSTDGLRVLSGGDDGTVKVWDVPTSRLLTTLSDAADYVRCQSPSPSSPHLWAAGSYDHHLRVYDLRTRGAPIFDIDHGAQVDDVHLLPGGGLAMSVGGPEARVWNLLGGGAVAATLGSHAKAVTCAAVRPDGRVFTGGLDAAVKVHNVATWEVMHTYFYSAQVLSVAASADGSRVGVGLVDGTAVVRHKDRAAAATAAKAARTAAGGARAGRRQQKSSSGVEGMEPDSDDASGEEEDTAPLGDLTGLPNFLGLEKSPFQQTAFAGWGRAGAAAPSARARAVAARGGRHVYAKGSTAAAVDADARIAGGVGGRVSLRLEPWDHALRRFDWRLALDAVLDGGPESAAVGVLEQLSVLGKLVDALTDRSEAELAPLVALLCRLLSVPEFGALMVEVAHVVLDLYGEKLGANALDALLKAVRREVRVLGQVEQCLGMCQLVLGRS